MKRPQALMAGLVLLAVIILTGGLLLASQAWRCPYCGQSFPWDPRDPAGLAAFQQGHQAVCPKKPGSRGLSGGGASGGGGSSGASSAQLQAASNFGFALGNALREMLEGNPQERARQEAEAARAAEEARQLEAQRQAELARKNQEILDKLQTQMKGSGFDGDAGGLTMKGEDTQAPLTVKLGDSATSDDGLRPQGTPTFGLGGGPGSVTPDGLPDHATRVASLVPQPGQPAVPSDSKAVDLRHLDPNRPITVDPNVVKGRERVFSVQVSQETLNNPNYLKGCQAFMNRDPAAALSYFQQVQQERPGDPLVRAQILLAQDLIKVKANKETGAYLAALEGVHAARNGDYVGAMAQFQKAHELNPQEKIITRWLDNLEDFNEGLEMMVKDQRLRPGDKATEVRALNLAGNAMVALLRGDYQTAQVVLEAARSIEPKSKVLLAFQEAVAEKCQDQGEVKTQGAGRKNTRKK